MTNKINIRQILPVLMAFFVMSFVDLVGVGVDKVKEDFILTPTAANLIPSAAFLWFLILSVPVGILQARYGKKLVLNIGMGVTALGLLVPFFIYTFPTVLLGFALLGIGNTIVQVSANPLIVDVVPSNRTSSFLSFSQFVKAIGSMLGAPLATIFASHFTKDWKMLFLVFGIVSLLSIIWLASTKVEEIKQEGYKATFMTSFKLLNNGFMVLMVISIFLVVGVDVGFNSNSGQFLMNHFKIDSEAALSGRSIYFAGRMIGTFLGAILLTRLSSRDFFLWTTVLGIIALVAILILPGKALAWVLVFVIGFAVANIFPLVFSIAVEKYPDRNSEISGLMIMAICGGAVIPLLIGWISQISHNVAIGMSLLVACMVYLLAVSLYCLKR
jgi:fucose permease